MAAFNKERTAKLIDPKWLGKDFNPSDEEQLTTQRLNTYLVDCIDSYMEGEFLDDILFLNLKDDFPDWTEEHFKLTDKTLRSNFKNYLKDHGIYIGNNGSVSAEITLALRQNKCPEWPEEEAERYRQFRKEKFQSYRNNPGFDKPDYNSPTPTKKVPNTTTKASKVKKIDKGKKVAENPNPDDDDSSDSSSDDGSHDCRSDGEWIPQEDILAPNEPKKGGKKRGRPPGSKNKPKPAAPKISSIDAAIANGMNLSMAYLTAKEKSDYALSLQLRKEGKITTAGEPFELSDQKEVDGLISRGVFEFTQYNPEKHGGIRIFKSRMVREVKGKTTDTPYEKSRLVIQGHSDQDKELVLTQSPTIQRASQRVIVALAPSLLQIEGMQLWLRDITQAYIQSTTVLQRKILAHLPKEIQHLYPPDTIMAVIKPLYGIAEAGTHWWATYFKHHRERLNMVTSTYDPCLLITSPSSTHFGIVGMQTDDTLGLSDENFAALEDEQLKEAKFLAKPRETLSRGTPLLFNGCVLSVQNDTLLLQQKKQGDKLKVITNAQEYVEQRARGAYIATVCQPEASFDLSAAAQHKSPEKEDIARLNKRIKWQMENIDRGLAYIPLNLHTAKLFVYVDGSFANNKDLSSQIGFVIFLANETTGEGSFTMTGNLIYWSSTKCKRITRSVLASEIYAMAHGVDTAIAVNTTIDMVLNKLSSIGGIPASLPLIVCTDSLSLYECLVKLGTTKEKRLMIDVMGLRQAYERHEIAEIRWIHGSDNPADAMTKGDPNRALQTFVDTNTITMRVQGQVTRNQVLKSD